MLQLLMAMIIIMKLLLQCYIDGPIYIQFYYFTSIETFTLYIYTLQVTITSVDGIIVHDVVTSIEKNSSIHTNSNINWDLPIYLDFKQHVHLLLSGDDNFEWSLTYNIPNSDSYTYCSWSKYTHKYIVMPLYDNLFSSNLFSCIKSTFLMQHQQSWSYCTSVLFSDNDSFDLSLSFSIYYNSNQVKYVELS